MDILNRISLSILIKETNEVSQILLTMVSSENFFINSEISIALIPFLSSIADGWVGVYKTFGIDLEFPDINGVSFEKLLKQTRVSYKLYTDKKNNKAKKLLRSRANQRLRVLESEYNFFQKLIISLIGQCDLGVFTFSSLPYGNTSQLSIYLDNFYEMDNIHTISILQQKSQTILIQFAEILSSFLYETSKIFGEEHVANSTKKSDIFSTQFEHKDYFYMDSKRRNILTGNLDDEIQLHLFNIYCQNNFIFYVFPKLFEKDTTFHHRTKIQTYLISVSAMQNISNKYSSSLSKRQKQVISNITKFKQVIFPMESQLRNNIFHYDVMGVSDNIFKENYFNDMIEYLSNKNFKSFIQEIDEQMKVINDLITDLINFKTV